MILDSSGCITELTAAGMAQDWSATFSISNYFNNDKIWESEKLTPDMVANIVLAYSYRVKGKKVFVNCNDKVKRGK